MGIEVEGTDMLADLLDGCKALCYCHASAQSLGLECQICSWDLLCTILRAVDRSSGSSRLEMQVVTVQGRYMISCRIRDICP